MKAEDRRMTECANEPGARATECANEPGARATGWWSVSDVPSCSGRYPLARARGSLPTRLRSRLVTRSLALGARLPLARARGAGYAIRQRARSASDGIVERQRRTLVFRALPTRSRSGLVCRSLALGARLPLAYARGSLPARFRSGLAGRRPRTNTRMVEVMDE